MKKTLTTLLVALMATLLFAVSAFAAGSYEFDSASGELTVYTTEGLTAWEGTIDPADIKSIVVKSAVNELKGSIFCSLTNLETLEFEGDVSLLAYDDGMYLYRPVQNLPSLKELHFGGKANISISGAFFTSTLLKEVTFGDAATLAVGCFSYTSSNPNNSLKELVFPAGSSFGDSVFTSCNALESVVFEGDVTVGLGCFGNLPALKTVEFKGESVFSSGAFSNAVLLEELTFAEKTTIPSGVFYYASYAPNTKLKELVFPEGSTFAAGSIGYLGALESIVFEGDATLNSGSFGNLPALKSIEFQGESVIGSGALSNTVNLETVTFAEKTSLGDGVLSYYSYAPNTKLKELVFPAGSSLGSGAVYYCNALEKVVFEGDITLNGGNLSGCPAIKYVEFMGESVIGSGAMSGLTNLETLIFAEKTSLGSGFLYFYDSDPNTKLKELVFPEGSSFTAGCVAYCNALESIVFEGDINVSYGSDLYMLPALKSIEFMGDVSLGRGSLYGAESLESLIFRSENVPTFETVQVFTSVNDSAIVYVPCYLVDEYTEAFEDNDVRGNKEDLEMAMLHDIVMDKNEEGHWDYCQNEGCDLQGKVMPHTFGEWVTTLEPTTEKAGEKERECTACGHIEHGTVDKLIVSDTENPDTGDTTNMAVYVALMAASMTALVVFKKRSFER